MAIFMGTLALVLGYGVMIFGGFLLVAVGFWGAHELLDANFTDYKSAKHFHEAFKRAFDAVAAEERAKAATPSRVEGEETKR